MAIDIDRLTEAELVDLDDRIVERLRMLNQMRLRVEMLEFRIGEQVEFQPEGHPVVVEVSTRYSRKTVMVISDAGQHRNVSPRFLRRASPKSEQSVSDPKIIRLPKG